MIISHKHRFIFLKTRKTAGTSIEMALRPLLGPDDVSTPWEPGEEAEYGPPYPMNHILGPAVWSARNIGRFLRGRPLRKNQLYGHDRASRIKDLIGESLWDSYYKFCFERNPWDRQVSLYYYNLKRHNRVMSFEQSLRRRRSRVDNWKIYTIQDRVAVDDVFRYENLQDDFERACQNIGIPAPDLPRAKTGLRENKDYRAAYSEATRRRVGKMYDNEIAQFGYSF